MDAQQRAQQVGLHHSLDCLGLLLKEVLEAARVACRRGGAQAAETCAGEYALGRSSVPSRLVFTTASIVSGSCSRKCLKLPE
jgi:hypothetical protein